MSRHFSHRNKAGLAGTTLACGLLLSGCGLFSGPDEEPAPTPAPATTEVPTDESGVPLPSEGVPYAPKTVASLHEDPQVAMLQAIGCFYAYDATTQPEVRDAYLACEDIATDVMIDEIHGSWMNEPPTPYEIDWEAYQEEGLRAASLTVDLISSGHDHGVDPNEPGDMEDDTHIEADHAAEEEAAEGHARDTTVYREAHIQLELTADGSQVADTLDFSALILLERHTPEDPWMVDLLGYLDGAGYEWEPAS
jgi:hypothetical protein